MPDLARLAGVWARDGAPAHAAELRAMLGVWHGLGDPWHWQQDGVALGGIADEAVEAVGAGAAPVAMFDGRLDVPNGAPAGAPDGASDDAEGVLAAWRARGADSLAALQGDFALAVFDPGPPARLLLARDAVGSRTLYFTERGPLFLFASDIKALLQHPAIVATPNRETLADWLWLPRLPADDDGASFFAGIGRLRPGHAVEATGAGVREWKFADFDPAAAPLRLRYEDAVPQLRELLRQAMRRQLRSRRAVAVSLSGGLDSCCALGLAHDLMRRGEAHAPLLVFSYKSPHDPEAQENRFLAMMENWTGLGVVRVPRPPAADWERLQRLAWHSEWPGSCDTDLAEIPLLSAARDHGARTLLTGDGSDQIFSPLPGLAELALAGRWATAARELQCLEAWGAPAAAYRAALPALLAARLTPRAWLDAMRGPRLGWQARRAAPTPAWTKELRRRRPALARPRFATPQSRWSYMVWRAAEGQQYQEALNKTRAAYGLRYASIFRDRDVAAFLMQLPARLIAPGGVPRRLLRDAMTGLVPDAVRWRDWQPRPSLRHGWHERLAQRWQLGLERRGPAAAGLGALPAMNSWNDMLGLEAWWQAFFHDRKA